MTDTVSKTGADPLEMVTGLPLARRSELLATTAAAIFSAGIDPQGRPHIYPDDAADFACFVLGAALCGAAHQRLERCIRDPDNIVLRNLLIDVHERVKEQLAADRNAEMEALHVALEKPGEKLDVKAT